MAKVTQAQLNSYVGGQMEIQNQIEGYLYRGEIEEIKIEGDDLSVKFKWLAKGEGYHPLPEKWVNDKDTNYSVNLMTASVNEVGNNRLAINTGFISNEMLVFFPPDGSKLDPEKVEGLTL